MKHAYDKHEYLNNNSNFIHYNLQRCQYGTCLHEIEVLFLRFQRMQLHGYNFLLRFYQKKKWVSFLKIISKIYMGIIFRF